MDSLPRPPAIRLEIVRDRTLAVGPTGGFADIRRLELVARYPDGTASAPFAYDLVERRAMDAAVMVAHYTENGARRVYLRSAVRPPLALRGDAASSEGSLWELPAGLVEPGETPRAAAARELAEELGFTVAEAQLAPLGPWVVPAPALVAETQHFFAVEVDPHARARPTEDGSALERGAAIVAVALADALAHCRAGLVRDAKTELGLRRLAEALA